MDSISPNLLTVIFVILALVVFVLGAYLGVVLFKLRQQKEAIKKLELEKQKNDEERDKFLSESILILSRAAIEKQCELSEACIRIKKLLENYPDIEVKEEFSTIQNMYVALSDFDYLEARKKLSNQEKFKQDNKRFAIEDEYREPMVKSLKLLITHFNQLA